MSSYSKLFFALSVLIMAVIFMNFSQPGEESSTNQVTDVDKHKQIFSEISAVRKYSEFRAADLFTLKKESGIVTAGNFTGELETFTLNRKELGKLHVSSPEHFSITIPVSQGKPIKLLLKKHKAASTVLQAGIINDNKYSNINYEPGIHYYGIIDGDENSIVSISIFEDQVMGLICNSEGNFNLSKVKEKNNDYVLFNDKEILNREKFTCGVPDNDTSFIRGNSNASNWGVNGNSISNGGSVQIYFECDFKMYQDFNSNTDSVINYVTGFFNSVKTLYLNENVNIDVSEIFVWVTQDPYLAYPSTLGVLKRFSHEKQNNFNGNLAHLLSSRTPNIGGIAWLDVICYPYLPSDSAGPTGFSSIFTTYSQFPVWSYTVQVVAHELGHNFASQHTHACVWPLPQGGIGALDSCYAVEGNCYNGPPIAATGTVMSYCIFVQGGSIDFNLGFGPRPGDTIRAAFNNAPCIIGLQNISNEVPASFELFQNYPNPFNPVTNIRFSIPKASNIKLTVYDVNGRLIETLINSKHRAGIYNFDWNASGYSSGVYFYKLESEGFRKSQKMILIK